MKTRAHTARPNVTPLGIDVPELQQARALWQLNRFDESLQLFDKAVRKYPQNLLVLVDASRAFGARLPGHLPRLGEVLVRMGPQGGG